jgi:hypothetical protein
MYQQVCVCERERERARVVYVRERGSELCVREGERVRTVGVENKKDGHRCTEEQSVKKKKTNMAIDAHRM